MIDRSERPYWNLLPSLLLAVLLVVLSLGIALLPARAEGETPPAPLDETSEYFHRIPVTTSDGSLLDQVEISGPPNPPKDVARPVVSLDALPRAASSALLPVPAYDWFYGCSATSAAMIAAYYDRNGYDNIYSGPTNGGVMPTDGSVWGLFNDGYGVGGPYYQCPLTASRNGLDGRTTRGSIDDYWVYYYAPYLTVPDPFIPGGWTEHTYGDAVGDYMRTGQSSYNNSDAMTRFYEWSSSPAPLTCNELMDIYKIKDDGSVGRKQFYEARGYTVTDCYNVKTDNFLAGGFTFTQYMAEIDAGRPVLINLVGHSIVGIGYDSATNTVYLNDTWDFSTHSMTWGGSYAGMLMEAATIVNLSLAGVDVRTLIVSNAGSGSGTVTSLPAGINCSTLGSDCLENFPTGTSVSLSATPAAGSYFTGWSGDCSGTGVCNVTMDAARYVTATFSSYTLTISKAGSGSGTVTSDPAGINCGADCTENYSPGTLVTLTAVPAVGSYFTGWSGDCSGTGACLVTMDDPRSVTATFMTYALTVSRTGTGTGTVTSDPLGIDCGADCTETYPKDTIVTLTAAPSPTATFTGWAGACSGVGTCVVTMDASKSVTAEFTLITYALNVTKDGSGGGTVRSTPSGVDCGPTCSYVFPINTVVTLSAWSWTSTFTGWSGACTGTGPCIVTMDAIKDVTATFTIKSFPLTVSKAGTGTGTVTSTPPGIDCGSDCSETYVINTSVTLSAVVLPGSTFTGWSGACTGTGTCILSMTAAKSVTATFNLITYTLDVLKTGTGSGTVTSDPVGIACGLDCTETYAAGTVVKLTAAASPGSLFTGWSGICSGLKFCYVTMSTSKSVTADFTLIPAGSYPVTVVKGGTGSGTASSLPAGISCGADCWEFYTSGTVVKLSAVADAGSTFVGWSGACGSMDYCYLRMGASKYVTANFVLTPPGTFPLIVARKGTGTGLVTSTPPGGISCGTDCYEFYTPGTLIKLTATASPGSTFTGWSGACGGTGNCWVTMSASRWVTATFSSTPPISSPADADEGLDFASYLFMILPDPLALFSSPGN